MPADDTLDPVYKHSRREAVLILILWGLSFAWTVPYCYFRGYGAPASPDDVEIAFGIPAWVWWGVALPWIVCGVISIALCQFYIRDDDLGHAADEVPHDSEN